MIKGVVFDIGGVLAYDVREYFFDEELIAKSGLDKRVVSEIQYALYKKYAYNKIGTPENWKEIENQYWDEVRGKLRLPFSSAELIALSGRYVRPVSHMMELVKSLKNSGLDLLICSNSTEFWHQRIKKLLALDTFFEERKMIVSNRFGASKSDPDFVLFKELEKQMDYPKEDYLFIDDRTNNIKRALQFGITALYFPAEAIYGNDYLKSIIGKINK